MSPTINTWLTRLFLLLCITIYSIHFWVILQNAVNVPYWDEWGILAPDALPAGFTFRWIFEQANEHRIVLTKLSTWGLFYISAHNHILSMAFTYLLYGMLLTCIVFVARKTVPHLPLWAILAFIVFLLTPINWENNFWGFESSFRFAVLFVVLASYFLFSEPQTVSRLALGAVMSVLATYSFFSGLVAVCILIVLFAWFKVTRAIRFSGPQRRAEYAQLIGVVTTVLIFIGVYFIDYHATRYHHQLAFPHEAVYWKFFTNLASWGFGFETHSVILGALCVLLVLTPIALHVWQRRLHVAGSSWAIYGVSLAMLVVLATIASGRAYLSASAKISRYSDFAMMFVPFTAFAWAILLKDRPNLKQYVLVGFWIFCCLGFSYKWLWFPVYSVEGGLRKQGVECIKTYYQHGGQALCPTLNPVPMPGLLDDAKKLNLSFYRDIAGSAERTAEK
jgi:hypothetical protein